MWWDTRKLAEPTEKLELNTNHAGGGQVLGGSSLDYNSEVKLRVLTKCGSNKCLAQTSSKRYIL